MKSVDLNVGKSNTFEMSDQAVGRATKKASSQQTHALTTQPTSPRQRSAGGSSHAPRGQMPTMAPAQLDHAAERTIHADRRKRDGILDEKARVGWTSAGSWSAKGKHKIESLLGTRTSQDKMREFIEFMANADPGSTGAACIPVGGGWTRHVRQVGAKVACLDVRTGPTGRIIDARGPAHSPPLPGGREKGAFSAVLDELRRKGGSQLEEVPVYFANRDNAMFVVPAHGYVVAGNPGKGRSSGAVLYGMGGDPNRGHVDVDRDLMNTTAKFKLSKLGPEVRNAVALLRGNSYASKEDFYNAYRAARGAHVDPTLLVKEAKTLYRLLPKSTLEMWPKTANGFKSPQPNTGEEDLRAFEGSSKLVHSRPYLKKQSNVKNTDLIEARRQFLLQQLYLDEKLGRVGTGIPVSGVEPTADEADRKKLVAAVPNFKMLPPHQTDKEANCNAGAATLLQRAMDLHAGQDEQAGTPKAASRFAAGTSHRMSAWDPLRLNKDAAEDEV